PFHRLHTLETGRKVMDDKSPQRMRSANPGFAATAPCHSRGSVVVTPISEPRPRPRTSFWAATRKCRRGVVVLIEGLSEHWTGVFVLLTVLGTLFITNCVYTSHYIP